MQLHESIYCASKPEAHVLWDWCTVVTNSLTSYEFPIALPTSWFCKTPQSQTEMCKSVMFSHSLDWNRGGVCVKWKLGTALCLCSAGNFTSMPRSTSRPVEQSNRATLAAAEDQWPGMDLRVIGCLVIWQRRHRSLIDRITTLVFDLTILLHPGHRLY